MAKSQRRLKLSYLMRTISWGRRYTSWKRSWIIILLNRPVWWMCMGGFRSVRGGWEIVVTGLVLKKLSLPRVGGRVCRGVSWRRGDLRRICFTTHLLGTRCYSLVTSDTVSTLGWWAWIWTTRWDKDYRPVYTQA